MPNVEEVFKKSGIPTYTFVKPNEYNNILVALRTPGRGIIIEGPSGIGKTTSIQKVIEELDLNKKVFRLSARKKGDIELIELLPGSSDMGTVIIDDFHVLPDETKAVLADHMKVLADEERQGDKLILVGINKAGDTLVKMAPDLNNRIDTIKLERNPDEKIEELIEKGEKALNINISTKKEIIGLSRGSFHIAQYLCNELCTRDGLFKNQQESKEVLVSIEVIKEKVLEEFGRLFFNKARLFAVGSKLRREGRAPYLHLLHWLSKSDDWTLSLSEVKSLYPDQKLSIGQVVDKNYLENLISNSPEIKEVIHYDANSRILTVEDPKFMFYIRNLLWTKFSKKIGYVTTSFKSKYDFALSFAGENRNLAERINELLLERQVEVFYDKNEQHRILTENVEDYLAPIYSSEARYVVALLSKEYPKKIWTKFESDNFRERFGDGSVVPIWYSDAQPGMFDTSTKVGGITFEVDGNLEEQAVAIVNVLTKMLEEDREADAQLELQFSAEISSSEGVELATDEDENRLLL